MPKSVQVNVQEDLVDIAAKLAQKADIANIDGFNSFLFSKGIETILMAEGFSRGSIVAFFHDALVNKKANLDLLKK